ncbi:molybdate ABC transporter permease subunit [Curtanaerobium respiraculi]|uniref:molybdate ABC transporter permease subunit n=1 Tax=Curtanaerobium respiraculi TaxID=2949669 RepID=UPI0024B33323|nr:molybdate ABC transporter permease subunit [Curtanaerobium respiraculi]
MVVRQAHSNKALAAALVGVCMLLFAALALPCTGVAEEAGKNVTTASGVIVPASSVSIDSNADVSIRVSDGADAAVLSTADFGIGDFVRQNKGTNRSTDGAYHGYQYTMSSRDAFSVVNTQGATLVHIPRDVADGLGIDISDEGFQSKFLMTLAALDQRASRGGVLFPDLNNTYHFTSEDTLAVGEYTYRFGVELSEGVYYATVTKAGSEDGSGGAVYMETGVLAPASETVVEETPTGLAALQRFFEGLDWSPLWVSLRTTGVAILVIFILGLLAAWLTLRVSDRAKGILDTLFTIPMVLPPTVCGFLLLVFFGTSAPTGRWFIAHGIDIVFTWEAAVIACIVVGFPLMYRTVRGAFENLDANMLDCARTLGWGEGRIFARIMLPLAWPSIAAGTVLAFARAMGEFGCTLFFAGNYAGITQTIPIAIYFDWMAGNTDAAIFWVIVVILVSFLVILFINVYTSRTQRYKRRLGE